MHSKKKIRQRNAMFKRQKGRCYWCNEEMLPAETKLNGQPHPRACTYDHLHDRFSLERGQNNNGEPRNVAACRRCNHTRGRQSESAVNLDELRRRSGRPEPQLP